MQFCLMYIFEIILMFVVIIWVSIISKLTKKIKKNKKGDGRSKERRERKEREEREDKRRTKDGRRERKGDGRVERGDMGLKIERVLVCSKIIIFLVDSQRGKKLKVKIPTSIKGGKKNQNIIILEVLSTIFKKYKYIDLSGCFSICSMFKKKKNKNCQIKSRLNLRNPIRMRHTKISYVPIRRFRFRSVQGHQNVLCRNCLSIFHEYSTRLSFVIIIYHISSKTRLYIGRKVWMYIVHKCKKLLTF